MTANKLLRLAIEIFLWISIFGLVPLAKSQVFELLHSFQDSDGSNPIGELLQASNGQFYGTTYQGGHGSGTVFQMTADGVLTSLVTFYAGIGVGPRGGMLQGLDGNLYGTTSDIVLNTAGTVFKITESGILTTLATFRGSYPAGPWPKGANPYGGLLQESDGNFYGTTDQGGGNSSGTVFKMTTNGTLTTLVSFNYSNGANPHAGLVKGNDGNFYGTTYRGGANNLGTVFKMTPEGALTTLVTFNNTNGSYPYAGMLKGRDGNFYGTTYRGGVGANQSNYVYGTVFKVTTNGSFTMLASFNNTNGANPLAKLTQGRDGYFYGTTSGYIGHITQGTVFRMAANGALSTLVTFYGTNGAIPYAALVQGNDDNFYGTTYSGGVSNFGTVFRILMPSLGLRRSGNDVVLSWPTNQVGFTLQSAVDLIPSSNWIDSTNLPGVDSGQFMVTNSISGSARFFRLRK